MNQVPLKFTFSIYCINLLVDLKLRHGTKYATGFAVEFKNTVRVCDRGYFVIFILIIVSFYA